MEIVTLESIVEAAIARWPGLAYKDGGSRADAAADLVAASRVKPLGTLYTGADYWTVDGHTCSIKSGTCDCPDYAAPRFNDGRLCKHRLAAMFVFKLQRAAQDRMVAIMNEAPDGEVTLRFEVLYGDGTRSYRFMGHHYRGLPWELYPHAEIYPFEEGHFRAALRICGYAMTQYPVRQRNFAYNYFVAKGADAGFDINNMAANDIDRMATNQRMVEITHALEMDAEMSAEMEIS